MDRDVWFCRYDGQLFVSLAGIGKPPGPPNKASSVSKVYSWLRQQGFKVASVGIIPPEAVGLD
jgi:hypothetical protein